MDEIKGIRIVSLTGEKEYGIEDSEVREELANVVDGAPEELDSFKEAFEKFKEGGEALAGIAADVAAVGKAVTDETTRAQAAEEELDRKITYEVGRAKEVENELANAIIEEDKKIAAEIDKLKNGKTIVGQAREIHSRNGKTVADSFLARTTAGSGTIGDGVASLKSVGGNIVKNLVDFSKGSSNPNASIIFTNGVLKMTPIIEGEVFGVSFKATIIPGHKYYGCCTIYIPLEDTVVFFPTGGGANTERKQGLLFVSHLTTGAQYNTSVIRIGNSNNLPQNNVCYIFNHTLIDLTEMFGTGKEPNKATCDKLFGTMDALPQGLTIANPAEFKSIGFNQFNPDNVLEGKAIANNAIVSGDKKIAVIPCLPCKVGVGENNGYCIHGDFGNDIKVYLTPLNPIEVEGELYIHELTKDATTDTYVPLIKGYLLVEVPTTTNLCAHFLWSEDKCNRDSYEPYFESKIEWPTISQMSEYGLAGIQTNGTLVCDEIDFERGVYVKKIDCVDLDTLNWTHSNYNNTSSDRFIVSKSNFPNLKLKGSILCDIYPSIYNVGKDKCILTTSFSNEILIIRDTSIANINDFYTAIQGGILYYELAEPIEYPLPKVDNNYISSDYGVEQFDSVIPCNANNLYYMRSLAGETRNFLDRLMAGLGTSDATVVADRILAVVNPAVNPANVEPETPIEE